MSGAIEGITLNVNEWSNRGDNSKCEWVKRSEIIELTEWKNWHIEITLLDRHSTTFSHQLQHVI